MDEKEKEEARKAEQEQRDQEPRWAEATEGFFPHVEDER